MYNPHLKTFIDVAQCGSFSKAAKKNYISTTAIIKQIKLLERDLEVELFVRTNNGVRLTRAGEYVYKEARLMIVEAEEIMRRAKELDRENVQTIRMGVSQRDYNKHLMSVIADYVSRNKDIQLEIIPINDRHHELMYRMSEIGSDLDIIFTSIDNANVTDNHNKLLLFKSPACLGMSRNHRLAKKGLLSVDDLEGETVYLLKQGISSESDEIRSSLNLLNKINIVDNDHFDYMVFNDALNEGATVLWAESWGEFNPMFKVVQVDWSHSIGFGIIYAENPSDAVKDLVRFLEQKRTQKYFQSVVSHNPDKAVVE